MISTIKDIPKLRSELTMIDGTHYNNIRLALSRLGNPLRVKLPGLRGMDILIDDNAWVCVDRTLYDLPVLAWTEFDRSERQGLHDPLPCMLHFYHMHADMISSTVLKTAYKQLLKMLKTEESIAPPSNITYLKKSF